ncbi:hypothetical protein [Phaeodactylibacter sp.]|jgi:hypothetical protein|uniref:hypothetical protein n=1 Tax=Phaeodactylibacter sp. TaxID=1940289 RepID=UPI0025F02073|nr:hypothetical protein [Phaeodactylibacter sp.]MCI4648593.1 hypothetical protein [Phaeodactylibacter sp.]MCI5089892.1 hypothetical protein [Phaeodactylibacter sp.]
MRQFKKALQSRLIEEDFEGVIKSLITLSDQMGNNLLMNEAMLYYRRWQELQRLSEPNTPDAERLKLQLRQGLWQITEQLPA